MAAPKQSDEIEFLGRFRAALMMISKIAHDTTLLNDQGTTKIDDGRGLSVAALHTKMLAVEGIESFIRFKGTMPAVSEEMQEAADGIMELIAPPGIFGHQDLERAAVAPSLKLVDRDEEAAPDVVPAFDDEHPK